VVKDEGDKRIKAFPGAGENAVKTHIRIAFCTYVLIAIISGGPQ